MSDDIHLTYPALESERLILRRMLPTDDEALFAITSIPSVTKFLTWEAHESIERTRSFIASVMAKYDAGQPTQWAITLKDGGTVIGTVGFGLFHFHHRKAEITALLSPAYAAMGYMSEAMNRVIVYCRDDLRLNRVEGTPEVDHRASEKMLLKAGMTYEGTMRKYTMRKGIARDCKMYATVFDYPPADDPATE